MSSYNYGDMIARAKEKGYDGGVELKNGTYDVRVNTANASKTNAGDDQIGVHFAAVSGAGTVWMNQILNPERDDMLAIFFNVMGRLGLPEEWFVTNSPSPEQIAETLKGVGPFRIEKSIRKTAKGGEFPRIKILGPATGEADVVSASATDGPAALPTVQAPVQAPVPQPAALPAQPVAAPVAAPPAPAPAPAAPVAAPVSPAPEVPSPPVAVEAPVPPAAPVAPPAPAAPAGDVPPPPFPTPPSA